MRTLGPIALLLLIVPGRESKSIFLEESCTQQVTFDLGSYIVGTALKEETPPNDSFSQSPTSSADNRRRKLSKWYLLRNIRIDCHREYTFLRSDTNYAASMPLSAEYDQDKGCRNELEAFSVFYIKETVSGVHARSCFVLENTSSVTITDWFLQVAPPNAAFGNSFGKFMVSPYGRQEVSESNGSDTGALDELARWISYEKYADLYAYILTAVVFAVTVCFSTFLMARWVVEKIYRLIKKNT